MSRTAGVEGVVAWVALAVAAGLGGCVPGPIAPRQGGAAGARGNAAGEGIVPGRDGAVGGDGSLADGRAGTTGSGLSVDAGRPELPTLPSGDAARATPEDAAADAISRDAPPPDNRPDAPDARRPRGSELEIDEVLVNPTGDDLGREWIELANLAGDWLDLSELHLANASVDVAVAGGAIAPGGLRVLGQSADPTKNGGAPVDVAYGTKLILNNADGQVSICLGACASGVVLDTVSWGTLGDAYTGHALIVDPRSKATCPAGAPFGTAGSFGTPGAPNPFCPTNTDGAVSSDSAAIGGISVAD